MRHYWFQPLLIPFTALTFLSQLLYYFVVKPSSVRVRAWAVEAIDSTPESRTTTIWGRPGGQCWGCRWLWFNTTAASIGEVNVHERCHAIQGEVVNAIAHAILIPLALQLDSGWWLVGAIAIGQLAFGISYGVHFAIESLLIRLGFVKVQKDPRRPSWYPAYMRIWAERMAYRIDDEYELGLRPKAWGREKHG